MCMASVARAVIIGAVALLLGQSAGAEQRTWYDVQNHKWVTYDPDKVRQNATVALAPAPHTQIVKFHRKPDRKFNRN